MNFSKFKNSLSDTEESNVTILCYPHWPCTGSANSISTRLQSLSLSFSDDVDWLMKRNRERTMIDEWTIQRTHNERWTHDERFFLNCFSPEEPPLSNRSMFGCYFSPKHSTTSVDTICKILFLRLGLILTDIEL